MSTVPSTHSRDSSCPTQAQESDLQESDEHRNGGNTFAEAKTSCCSYDIGEIVACCQSEKEVAMKLQSLSRSQKYALLTKHSTLPEDINFPITFAGGYNHSFCQIWLKEH